MEPAVEHSSLEEFSVAPALFLLSKKLDDEFGIVKRTVTTHSYTGDQEPTETILKKVVATYDCKIVQGSWSAIISSMSVIDKSNVVLSVLSPIPGPIMPNLRRIKSM